MHTIKIKQKNKALTELAMCQLRQLFFMSLCITIHSSPTICLPSLLLIVILMAQCLSYCFIKAGWSVQNKLCYLDTEDFLCVGHLATLGCPQGGD